jgi:hypothetical protein
MSEGDQGCRKQGMPSRCGASRSIPRPPCAPARRMKGRGRITTGSRIGSGSVSIGTYSTCNRRPITARASWMRACLSRGACSGSPHRLPLSPGVIMRLSRVGVVKRNVGGLRRRRLVLACFNCGRIAQISRATDLRGRIARGAAETVHARLLPRSAEWRAPARAIRRRIRSKDTPTTAIPSERLASANATLAVIQ